MVVNGMIRGWGWRLKGTYRLVDPDAYPNPCFFRLGSNPLNEFTLGERLGQRRYFIRPCDEV